MRASCETNRAALLIPTMAVVGFAFTVYVFYPGIPTFDSLYIYKDMLKGAYGDWQSPAMLALWSVIDPIAPGSGSMLMLTVALYWLAFAILALEIARYSPNLSLVVPPLALLPPAFVLLGVIWRDILFGTSWLLAAALVVAVFDQRAVLRVAAQTVALILFAFGVLLRPNALAAAPLLAAYLLWPAPFNWKRTALLYVPAAASLFGLVQITYYGLFDAERQHPLHSIIVFDLGGISHFSNENMFPGRWSKEEDVLIRQGCYKPIAWDIYWTQEPCMFVMERLESKKLFGTPALTQAWWQAIVSHPMAYLQHRAAFQWTFLTGRNLAMWTRDFEDPNKILFADSPRLMAIKAVNDTFNATPLFRAGAWLVFDAALCVVGWRRRSTPAGAFTLGVCGSAVVYLMTFFVVGVSTDLRYAYWAVLAGISGAVTVAQKRKPAPFMEQQLSTAA